jgi:hypothetical protein
MNYLSEINKLIYYFIYFNYDKKPIRKVLKGLGLRSQLDK